MHLENPEALGNPAAGSEEANKRAAEANQRGGELLRDSLFGQSQQKKGEGRRRDLESINEDGESKHYEEDFESVKQDDNMFSLSNSYPAKEPYAKPGNQSSRGKFAQQIHRIEEGGPPSHPDSYPADFESNLGSAKSRKLDASESSRRPVPPSPKTAPLKPAGASFVCTNCRKTLPVDILREHLNSCLRGGDKRTEKLRISMSQEGVKESMIEEMINSASRSSVLKKSGRLT